MNKPTGTPWRAVLPLVTALLYGASPIDLIPDIIPLLGWVDDALIVPLLLLVAFVQLRKRSQAKPVRISNDAWRPPRR
jgi:uncharacterized membrane protein YkvA (DUF1232 family)